MKKVLALAVALVALLSASVAQAADFTNGDVVAVKMERHYNATAYRLKLKQSGARLLTRVLCAYDGFYQVRCTSDARYNGKRVSLKWELVKRTKTRAELTWTVQGSGVFDIDSAIVRPKDYALRSF